MPGTRVTITTTPTLLAAAKSRDQRAYIHIDNDSAVRIYTSIGTGSDGVTTTDGRPLAAGATRMIHNTPTDSEATGALYGVVATGTASVLVTEGT